MVLSFSAEHLVFCVGPRPLSFGAALLSVRAPRWAPFIGGLLGPLYSAGRVCSVPLVGSPWVAICWLGSFLGALGWPTLRGSRVGVVASWGVFLLALLGPLVCGCSSSGGALIFARRVCGSLCLCRASISWVGSLLPVEGLLSHRRGVSACRGTPPGEPLAGGVRPQTGRGTPTFYGRVAFPEVRSSAAESAACRGACGARSAMVPVAQVGCRPGFGVAGSRVSAAESKGCFARPLLPCGCQ